MLVWSLGVSIFTDPVNDFCLGYYNKLTYVFLNCIREEFLRIGYTTHKLRVFGREKEQISLGRFSFCYDLLLAISSNMFLSNVFFYYRDISWMILNRKRRNIVWFAIFLSQKEHTIVLLAIDAFSIWIIIALGLAIVLALRIENSSFFCFSTLMSLHGSLL